MSTMSTTEFNVERVLELVSVMPPTDQWTIAESILRGLKKSSKAGKTSKAKKERDPDAPKREPSDWIKHTTHVRQFLDKEHKGVACTQIASMLKDEGKMFADEDDVMDAYARWKENPPVKADKKSVSDSASDGEKPKRKWSDEAKANAKAKREAKKAAAAESESESESEAESVAPPPKPVAKPAKKPAEKPAEKPAVEAKKMAKVMKPKAEAAPAPVAKVVAKTEPAPVAKVVAKVTKTESKTGSKAVTKTEVKAVAEVKADVQQEGEFWEHNFGSGVEKYERFPGDLPHTFYIFHPTDGYMGLWDEDLEELDADVADPTA